MEDGDALYELIKEARSNGVVGINGLAMILGFHKGYTYLLPVLWKEYGLDSKENNLIPRKDYDIMEPDARAAMWYYLLLRWTRTDGGMFRKLDKRLANYLPLHPNDRGEVVNIKLKEFETYVQGELNARHIEATFSLPDELFYNRQKEFIGNKEIYDEIRKRLKTTPSAEGIRSFLRRKGYKFRRTVTGKPVITEQELDELAGKL